MPPARVRMLVPLLVCAALARTAHCLQNVSLIVSSLRLPTEGEGPDLPQRELEMNWQPGLDADWIGLFSVSPPHQATQETEPLIRISTVDYPDGYYCTNISFTEQHYPNGWNKGSGEKAMPGDACLSYWIAAYKNDQLLQAECLKIHPTWMEDHRATLENMPLVGLFFPGTYNSDHYNRESTPLPKRTVSHHLLTQHSDVWGDLVCGVRYLDVDIGHGSVQQKTSSIHATPEDDRHLVNHDLVHANHLLPVLEDVKEFLKAAKYEIVILDFHHFPVDFNGQSNLHQKFVSLLYSELGDYILPFNNITYNTTLDEVWSTGHNLIVAYDDNETTKEFAWLWGPIPRLWGDHRTTEGLKVFLQQCMDDASTSNRTTSEASMTRTAPTTASSTLDTPDSLLDLVDMARHNITKWFHNYWWRHANLVATDFFLHSGLTDGNVRACLDKANNIIFQVASEDE